MSKSEALKAALGVCPTSPGAASSNEGQRLRTSARDDQNTSIVTLTVARTSPEDQPLDVCYQREGAEVRYAGMYPGTATHARTGGLLALWAPSLATD